MSPGTNTAGNVPGVVLKSSWPNVQNSVIDLLRESDMHTSDAYLDADQSKGRSVLESHR